MESKGSDGRGELVIVTGMTGAGRSTAAKVLEDIGYFVVDNLPPRMVEDLVALVDERWGVDQPLAVVVDVRSGTNFLDLRSSMVERITTRTPTVLFLEADDDILIRRQDAARRPHPLQGGDRLLEGVVREREVLGQLRAVADLVIDTTGLNVHQLKARVASSFGRGPDADRLQINVLSFGFKYGVPVDADLMADMRFLPNPFWVPELRDHTGQQDDVATYVRDRDDAQEFLARYVPVIETVSAGYLREGKRFMTVAIGCTGGKHRSVAMTEELVRRLRDLGLHAEASHRDLGRE
ncbi:MAG: RNase adapter RapZ [Myxococcales bacterium]|nr:MAG: RNase adapter RapZ [Myxococcales bacterium]